MGRQQKLKALRHAPSRGSLTGITLADVAKRCYEKYGRGIIFHEEGRLPGCVRPAWCPYSVIGLGLSYSPEHELALVLFEGPAYMATRVPLQSKLGSLPIISVPGLDTLDKVADAAWIDTHQKSVAFFKSHIV